MKEREVEHVRYRATANYESDVELQSVVQCVRSEVRHAAGDSQDFADLEALLGAPGSASVDEKDANVPLDNENLTQ